MLQTSFFSRQYLCHLLKNYHQKTMTSRLQSIPLTVAADTMAYLHETGRIETTSAGCHIAQVSTVRGSQGTYRQVQPKTRATGLVRSRGRASGKTFTTYQVARVVVHQVAFLHHHGAPPAEGLEVSHLCGIGSCCNPLHLVAESHAINMSRQNCLGTVTFSQACAHMGCAETHYMEKLVCKHVPACLVWTSV